MLFHVKHMCYFHSDRYCVSCGTMYRIEVALWEEVETNLMCIRAANGGAFLIFLYEFLISVRAEEGVLEESMFLVKHFFVL